MDHDLCVHGQPPRGGLVRRRRRPEDSGDRPLFESHHVPDRANTEFVKVLDRENIQMRVWERGAGETLACGTGACATAYAAFRNGLCGRKVTVHLLGGDLEIEITTTLF